MFFKLLAYSVSWKDYTRERRMASRWCLIRIIGMGRHVSASNMACGLLQSPFTVLIGRCIPLAPLPASFVGEQKV